MDIHAKHGVVFRFGVVGTSCTGIRLDKFDVVSRKRNSCCDFIAEGREHMVGLLVLIFF